MKKGFTLIELLAVIVILAVISIIAVPIILDIIEDSRRGAALASANGYVRAVNYKIAQEALNDRAVDESVDYVIGENALQVTGKNIEDITGSYTLANGSVEWAGLCINHYSISYNSGVTAIDKTGNYCEEDEPYEFIEPAAELMSAACTNTSKYDSESAFKIKTVEDLACLANLVNSGKNFSGKTVYLLNDIDIASDSSYKDKNTTAYGDINGNNTVEGLKVELTTGSGFKPIGNSGTRFSGTFLGYAFTISNLKINRNTQYLGMFGYNSGLIKGVILKNASITSTSTETSSYIGGITGYSEGNIKSVSVEGSVTGNGNYVGGVAGYVYKAAGGLSVDSALFKGTVTTSSSVGGLVGYISGKDSNHSILNGVTYSSTIESTYTGTGNISVGLVAGSVNSNTYIDRNIKNYSSSYTSTKSRYQGYDGNSVQAFTLEAVDGALDTYIGGDNDSDGYYFDYDNDGNIVLYSTERTPIQNKLKGTGTDVDPYLIRNDKDWKMASTLVTQSKYFKVTNNIDFNNKKYYALGTDANIFNGNINGNMHNISNISVYGYSNVGLFGYNQGTIEGFRFDNITVSATGEYVGGIVGRNTGLIKGVEIKNTTISSTSTETNSYIGGITGHSEGNIKSVSVEGSVTGNGNYVGGVAGYVYKAAGGLSVDSALFKGTVTTSSSVGGIVGYISGKESNHSILKGVTYSSTIESTYTGTGNISVGLVAGSINSNSYIDSNIKNYSSSYTSTKSRYQGYDGNLVYGLTLDAVDGALDTYIGGDNDSDGYYFDYNNDGNIALYSTAEAPIQNTLEGSGTENSPYLIKNENDWKMASALVTQSKYFSVTSDIDFNNKKFYALGTDANKFNGNINGNMHNISNINVYGYSNVGLFGYNQGTIEGFRFNNITVSATGEYVGGISGHNSGLIKGIELKNTTVSSTSTETNSYIGGITGHSEGHIKSVSVESSITGNGNYVGGVAGYVYKAAGGLSVDSVLFKGTITTSNSVGGLVGYISGKESNHSILKGVTYNSTINATFSTGNISVGLGAGAINSSSYIDRNIKNYSSSYVAPRARYQGYDGTEISSLAAENVDGALDTYLNGDDGDGYYFGACNGNLKLLSVVLNPIDNTSCPATVTPTNEVYEENTSNPTHGGIVYLNLKNISQTCTKTNVDSNVNSNGKLTGVKEGCMRFYIIGEDSTNYKLLLDHNTSGNVSWAIQSDFIEAGGDLTEWQTNEGSTSRGPVTANKRLQSDTTGWSGNPRLPSANEIAHITGADTSLSWATGKTYANPVTDKTTQIGRFYFDGSGNSYTGWTNQVATSSNKSRYSWLYNNTYNCKESGCRIEDNNKYATSNNGTHEVMGYWTSDAYNINYPWAVTSSGQLGSNDVTDSLNMGIRPVITIAKTSVTVN